MNIEPAPQSHKEPQQDRLVPILTPAPTNHRCVTAVWWRATTAAPDQRLTEAADTTS